MRPSETTLRRLRIAAGLSQEQLAYRAGRSLATIAAADRHGVISTETAAVVARVLKCDPADLFPKAPVVEGPQR